MRKVEEPEINRTPGEIQLRSTITGMYNWLSVSGDMKFLHRTHRHTLPPIVESYRMSTMSAMEGFRTRLNELDEAAELLLAWLRKYRVEIERMNAAITRRKKTGCKSNGDRVEG